jgi:LPXTG-motif cell wall-anchored protein
VKTGDTSFLLLWVAVLVMAVLLGIIMLVIYRKNLDKKDEKDRE